MWLPAIATVIDATNPSSESIQAPQQLYMPILDNNATRATMSPLETPQLASMDESRFGQDTTSSSSLVNVPQSGESR